MPLLFRNQQEVDYVRSRMDGRIIDGLDGGGIISFSLAETGFAYMLTSEPVASVEDLKKVKAWVPDGDPVAAKLIQSFGISPIPLGLPDVLAGLQTGLIDAVRAAHRGAGITMAQPCEIHHPPAFVVYLLHDGH